MADVDHDYEHLPEASWKIHMTAGLIAGVMEHCICYPLDSVKTQMQSLTPIHGSRYRSILETLTSMVQKEGLLRPVRGISAVIIGAGPAHALYFSSYEKIKEVLLKKLPSHGQYSQLAYGSAGCIATLFHDGIMTPADVIKQRMQMYASPYSSVIACVKSIYSTEGPRAFYRSYSTQLTMNIPFQSIHFMTYEFMTTITNPDRKYNPKAHLISGAVAGAFAAAITTPLDVCKTLLNTQESLTLKTIGQDRITGISNAFRTIYKIGGVRGYFQGMSARILYVMPSTSICWSVYEFFKWGMGNEGGYKFDDTTTSELDLKAKINPQI